MKKLAIILGALALFVVQPVAGQAPPLPTDAPQAPADGDFLRYLGYYGGGGSINSGVAGPYYGAFVVSGTTVGSSFTMYCVDFTNTVTTNATWQINATRLSSGADLANTRLGRMGWTNALFVYNQVAWLSEKFASDNKTDWTAIHGAIWSLTGATSFTLTSAMQGLITQAQGAVEAGYSARDWYVLSALNCGADGVCARQEFIVRYSVPEPGVIVLLLSGLLGVAFVARRRASQLS